MIIIILIFFKVNRSYFLKAHVYSHLKSFIDGSTGNVNSGGMENYKIGLFGNSEKEFFDAFDP